MQSEIKDAWRQLVASKLYVLLLEPQQQRELGSLLARSYAARSQHAGTFEPEHLSAAIDEVLPNLSEPSRAKLLLSLGALILGRVGQQQSLAAWLPNSSPGQPANAGGMASTSTGLGGGGSASQATGPANLQHGAISQNPLLGLTLQQMASQVAKELHEPSPKAFEQFAKKLGAEGCWHICQETSRILKDIMTGNVSEADSDAAFKRSGDESKEPRTSGGIFLNLAKKAASAKAKTMETYLISQEPRGLRPYQQDCLESIWEKQGNWVIVAPTGSGKTELVVQYTKRLLQKNPGAKTVVLVPTVLLTRQHASYFETSAMHTVCPGFQVDHFSGDKPLLPDKWRTELSILTVMVMVADVFANLVRIVGPGVLQSIDLLVIDECHHVTGDHPYAKIMDKYVAIKDTVPKHQQRLPTVLGITASPVGSVCQAQIQKDMAGFLRRLGCGDQLYHIHREADPSLTACLPQPDETLLLSAKRSDDGKIRSLLGATLADAASILGESLASDVLPTANMVAHGKLLELLAALQGAIREGGASDEMRNWIGRLYNLVKAASQRMQFAAAANPSGLEPRTKPLRKLMLVTKLLMSGSKAVDMASNLGYECALQFMARKLVSLCVRSADDEMREIGGPTHAWKAGYVESDNEDNFDAEDGHRGQLLGLSNLSSQHLRKTQQNPAELRLQSVEAGRAGGMHMGDLQLSVQQVAQIYLSNLLPPLDGAFMQRALVNHHQPSGRLLPPPDSFPKIWDLKNYLQKFRERESFHGIIFASTRHAVFYLSSIIRAAHADLPFIQTVHEIIGHGGKLMEGGSMNIASKAGVDEEEAQLTGMSGAQQMSVLNAFKAPGRRVLIATSAAEEGLDVPTCEFVVRFNASVTGIQRVQSRGRARALKGAEFVVIMQSDSLDEHHNNKSSREETNMNILLQNKFPRIF